MNEDKRQSLADRAEEVADLTRDLSLATTTLSEINALPTTLVKAGFQIGLQFNNVMIYRNGQKHAQNVARKKDSWIAFKEDMYNEIMSTIRVVVTKHAQLLSAERDALLLDICNEEPEVVEPVRVPRKVRVKKTKEAADG